MKDISAITGAEYAERLLAVNSPTRLIDHLIEKLAAKTGTGWESNLLEFKGSYHKRPDSDDPDSQDCFEWNVMHAFVALANAQGGCVVIGIAETDDHQLVPGDWDPDGILGCRDADGDGKPIPGREEKDLVDHVTSVFFKGNGRTYKFTKQNKRNPSAPPTAHEFTLDAETLSKLLKLVTFYPCHSERCSCNALAAIVHPVKKDDDLIEVCRTKKNRTENVIFYRDRRTAKTCELTKYRDIRNYEENREPASSDFLVELSKPIRQTYRSVPVPFSNVPKPTHDFVGRSDQISNIRAACLAGKITLLQAAGGTGKTQLLLQYACQYEAEYIGGRFFLQLDEIKSWTAALELLTSPHININGLTPRHWLGLPEYIPCKEDSQNQNDSIKVLATLSVQEVVGALSQQVKQTGPILIILDNIDEPEKLLSASAISSVFPQGIPSDIHIVASARTAEHITPLRAPKVSIISLEDLSEPEAMRVLLDEENLTAQDQKLLSEIARLLGHRALYLHRISWLIDEEISNHNPVPLKTILQLLKRDLFEAIQPLDDDKRTPSILWQWTQDRLNKDPVGPKAINLVRAIAFYAPAGIPVEILEGLWHSNFGEISGREMLTTLGDGTFEHALQLIIRHKLISLDEKSNRAQMHRLDRFAIQNEAIAQNADFINLIGRALASNPCCSPADWVELSATTPSLMQHCPWSLLNGHEFASILAANPDCAQYIPDWSMISPDEWVTILSAHSSFDNHAECNYAQMDPVSLANHRPDLFVNRFDKETVTKRQWLAILSQNPELYEHCPSEDRLYTESNTHSYGDDCWDTIYGRSWGTLLKQQPQFKKICKFSKLSVHDWRDIVIVCPEYATTCNWEMFSKYDLIKILAAHPEFSGLPDVNATPDILEIADAEGKAQRLSMQPTSTATQTQPRPSLSLIKEGTSAEILFDHPQLASFRDKSELQDYNNGKLCLQLVRQRPCFVDSVIWPYVDDYTYSLLIPFSVIKKSYCGRRVDEMLIKEYGADWNVDIWDEILYRHPEYASVSKIRKILNHLWTQAIAHHKTLQNKLNWDELNTNDWTELLQRYPEAKAYCPANKRKELNIS